MQKIKNKLKTLIKKIINRMKNVKKCELIILYLLSFTLLIYRGWSLDVDIWFILNGGRYIYTNHAFPHVDPYTIHENLKFVMQQWGYAVIAWPLFKHVGAIGIFILNMLLYLVIIFLTYKLCMIISDKNKRISILISAIINILLVRFSFITLRPQMFTFINLTLYLIVLEKYLKNSNSKTLFWLIPISVLQINLHAAMWWMLFIFALPFVVELFINQYILKKEKKCDSRKLIVILILSFFAGLINPYGVDAITYFINSYNPFFRELIIEMHPTQMFSTTGITIMLILISNFYIFTKRSKENKTFKISYFLFLFGTLCIAINTVKCFSLYIISTIYPFAYYCKNNLRENSKDTFKNNSIIYKICYISIIILLISLTTHYFSTKINLDNKRRNESQVEYLKELYGTDNIRLYIDYNSGSYAEFIGFKTYIDSRAEEFFESMNQKNSIFDEYYYLQNGHLSINEFIEKYQFTHLIINEDDTMFTYKEIDNYHIIKEDEYSRLYEKDDFIKK